MRELLSTDTVRVGYLVQVSRGWVSPGMGLGNEGPGQAGEDPTVAFNHGQAPWSTTEGAPSWQQEPLGAPSPPYRAWAGCEPARWQRAMCQRIITVKNSLGFLFFF